MEENEILRRFVRNLTGRKNDGRVTVVDGAPGSGKTTYVREQMKQGDLVMDLDAICQALNGSESFYKDTEAVIHTALVARDAILESIGNREGKWNHAYVITAEPDSEKVDRLVRDLQADRHTMTTDRETCISQIRGDGRRGDKTEMFEKLADAWFKEREGQ